MNTQTSFHRFLQVISHHFVPNIGTVLAVILLLFVYNTQAASTAIERSPASPNVSPSTISYQGTLSTASGDPVNGSVGMTFRLYNVSSGGSALWTETRTGGNAVPVSNGLFHVLLGNLTPIPANVWENTNVYLGVQIEGDSAELSPREMVGAVPVAMMATNIVIPDGSITTTKIADGAITQSKLDPNIHLSPDIFADVGGGVDITTSSAVLNSSTISLNEQASVLVTITARAIYTQDGDEFQFFVMRDGVHILPGGNIHFQAARSDGHQYLTYTFVDTNVPSGSHTYEFSGVLSAGSGTRLAHEPTIILMPLP